MGTIIERPLARTADEVRTDAANHVIHTDHDSATDVSYKMTMTELMKLTSQHIRTTGNIALGTNHSYGLTFDVTNSSHSIIIPNGQSHLIANVSAASLGTTVVTLGNANLPLAPGEVVYATWSSTAARHLLNKITAGGGGGGVTVDDAVTQGSENPVESSGIFTFVENAFDARTQGTVDTSGNLVTAAGIKSYVDAAIVGGTLDDFIDPVTPGGNAVTAAGIKAFVDQRSQVKSYDKVVTNLAEFKAACIALSAQGYGTLWVDGRIVLDNNGGVNYRLFGASSIRGLGVDSEIEFGQDAVGIVIGHDLRNINGSTQHGQAKTDRAFAMDDVVLTGSLGGGEPEFRKDSEIQTYGLVATEGDWLQLFSWEHIPETECIWHDKNHALYPSELVMVQRDLGGGKYRLHGHITEQYKTRNGPMLTLAGDTFTCKQPGFVQNYRVHLKITGSEGNLNQTDYYYLRDVTEVAGPTITADIASDTFTLANHGLLDGDPIQIQTTGNLGFDVENTYYVIRVDANQFKLHEQPSLRQNGAGDTTPINIAANSGTHTIRQFSFRIAATSGGAAITPTQPASTYQVVFKPVACNMIMANSLAMPGGNGSRRSNVVVDNIRFTSSDIAQTTSQTEDAVYHLITFYNLDGVTVRNCRWEIKDGIYPHGEMAFHWCTNVEVIDNIHEGTNRVMIPGDQFTGRYGVVAGLCSEMRIANNFTKYHRHFFTTGGSGVDGNGIIVGFRPRAGGPINCIVEDNVCFHVSLWSGSSQGTLDTHAEGYGVIFRNNLVIASEHSSRLGQALKTRSRKTQFERNTVYAMHIDDGIRTDGPDATIVGNILHGCLSGVQLFLLSDRARISENKFYSGSSSSTRSPIASVGFPCVDVVVSNNQFFDVHGHCIDVDFLCDRWRITGNQFHDCGVRTNLASALIQFNETGADSAKDVLIADNVVTNYKINYTDIPVVWFKGSGDGNKVINNKFYGCKTGWAAKFDGGNNHEFSSNRVENHLGGGVYFSGGTGHRALNNVYDKINLQNTGNNAFRFHDSATDTLVSGNTVREFSESVISTSAIVYNGPVNVDNEVSFNKFYKINGPRLCYFAGGDNNDFIGNYGKDCSGNAIEWIEGDGHNAIDNTIINSGTSDTGTALFYHSGAGADLSFIRNTVVKYRTTAGSASVFNVEGNATGRKFIGNIVDRANVAQVLSISDGSDIRIAQNDFPFGSVLVGPTRALSLGLVGAGDLRMVGNSMDGYGTSGTDFDYMTGASAAAIHAAYGSKNWID